MHFLIITDFKMQGYVFLGAKNDFYEHCETFKPRIKLVDSS